jgi:hypothetical protein
VRLRLAAAALAAAATTVAAGQSPAGACACGIAIDATVMQERALVIEHRHGEAIVLSLNLASDDPKARAAVVVPVPGLPTVAAVEHGDPLAYLEQATAPSHGQSSGGVGETAGAGVDVIGRDQVGGYDVARLGASDGTALQAWLDEHGYSLQAEAEPILSDYADEGWRFVAIRLARGSEGDLKPLKISFDSEETVYPMRLEQLATEPLALTLFVLAPAERRIKGYDRSFSKPVDELEPPPPAELEELFSADDHVTRLDIEGDAEDFKRDLVIEPIPKPPGVSGEDEEGFSSADFALVGIGGFAILAVALLVQLRRHRRTRLI